MNSEYALNSCKSLLEANLETMISTVEAEASATYFAPTPQEFVFGQKNTDIMSLFPNIQIIGKNTGSKSDEYNFQVRTLRFDIIAWIIESELEKLDRYVMRYADSIIRCLRNESSWASSLSNPLANDAIYSEVYDTSFGMAKGCLVTGNIDYIIS